jgi:hypothetical protein
MRRGINIMLMRHSVTFYIQWLSWFFFICWCECHVVSFQIDHHVWYKFWHQQRNLAWFWIRSFVEGCSCFHILVLIYEMSCTVISYSTCLRQSYMSHTYAHGICYYIKDIQYLIQKNSHLVMNNDLSLPHTCFDLFMVIIRKVHTKAYRYNKFYQRCAYLYLKKVESMH